MQRSRCARGFGFKGFVRSYDAAGVGAGTQLKEGAAVIQMNQSENKMPKSVKNKPLKQKKSLAGGSDAKELFKKATPEAAQLLIETVKNEDVKLDVRLDCANRILERVYGKASAPIDGEDGQTVHFILGEGLGELAK